MSYDLAPCPPGRRGQRRGGRSVPLAPRSCLRWGGWTKVHGDSSDSGPGSGATVVVRWVGVGVLRNKSAVNRLSHLKLGKSLT